MSKGRNVRLLFSIAVHESTSSVYDLIQNIKYFCVEPIIILHVSKVSNLFLDINKFENVYINDVSLITGFADGTLTFVHKENFFFAEKLKLNYEYFIPFGSNELFIKHGVEQYIDGTEKSYSPPPSENNYHYLISKQDKAVKTLIGDVFFKSAPEGTFYHKKLLTLFFNDQYVKAFFEKNNWIYKTFFGYRVRVISCLISKVFYKLKVTVLLPSIIARYSYASEEIIFPSINSSLNCKDKFCFIPWERESIKVSISDIEDILNTCDKYFSVKRVERDFNDSVRSYIRHNLGNNYLIDG